MTKEKWIEFFKVINDRLPNEEELAEAFAKGEFTIEHEKSKEDSEKLDNNFSISPNTTTSLSYPLWLLETLKHPSKSILGKWYYPLINTLLSSVILAVSVGQFFWKIINLYFDTIFASIPDAGKNGGLQLYTLLMNHWKELVSYNTYFYVMCLLVCLYLVILMFPVVVANLVKIKVGWKLYASERLGFTTIAMISNILLFVSVWSLPAKFIILNSGGIPEIPIQQDFSAYILTYWKLLTQQVSGIDSFVKVIALIFLFRLTSFLVLTIGCVNNLNQFKVKLDSFYIKFLYILLIIFLFIFVEKIIGSRILSIIGDGIVGVQNIKL